MLQEPGRSLKVTEDAIALVSRGSPEVGRTLLHTCPSESQPRPGRI
jgi:hypothetical protein